MRRGWSGLRCRRPVGPFGPSGHPSLREETLIQSFAAALKEAVRTAFGDVDLTSLEVQLADTPEPSVGDLGFGCFPLAKPLRRSPKDIAERLAAAIQLPPPFQQARAVGPYLNLFLDRPAFLGGLCREVLEAGHAYGNAALGQRRRIVLEFSSPNTNKPQHLGHIRNNVLGMAIAQLLEAIGYDVAKVNLINDRGVHICQSMLAYQQWGNGETPESSGKKGDHFVGDYYVRFAREVAEEYRRRFPVPLPSEEEEKARQERFRNLESELAQAAQAMLRAWEAGDAQVVALWKQMNGWVYEGFDATYRRLGVVFDRIYRESQTYSQGREIVLGALERALCTRLPDGAVEVDLTDDGLDKKTLLRRDGTTLYITQDLGTAVRRFEEWSPDRLYYVVASEQIYHFKLLFTILKRFGYAWAEQCRHICYGMVYLPEGKMKSREGKVVDADGLLDEVEALSAEAVLAKHPDLSPDELALRKRQIALGAIRFYLLNVNLDKDIYFDPAASVSFEGDTGPYIQYSHTRICGILRKAASSQSSSSSSSSSTPEASLGNDDEMALGLLLLRFPRAVRDAAETCNPARLAGHVLEIARSFAQFYHDNPVLQAETPDLVAARLELCRAVQVVLQRGLRLLGIDAPEQM